VIISSGKKVADATVKDLKEQNQEQSLEKIFHKLTGRGNA
jgi:ABC-type Na+ transport system ATPase subunit NatA